MSTLITYESNNEIIITTKEDEGKTIDLYFAPYTKRIKGDFDRYEHETSVCIASRPFVR